MKPRICASCVVSNMYFSLFSTSKNFTTTCRNQCGNNESPIDTLWLCISFALAKPLNVFEFNPSAIYVIFSSMLRAYMRSRRLADLFCSQFVDGNEMNEKCFHGSSRGAWNMKWQGHINVFHNFLNGYYALQCIPIVLRISNIATWILTHLSRDVYTCMYAHRINSFA